MCDPPTQSGPGMSSTGQTQGFEWPAEIQLDQQPLKTELPIHPIDITVGTR